MLPAIDSRWFSLINPSSRYAPCLDSDPEESLTDSEGNINDSLISAVNRQSVSEVKQILQDPDLDLAYDTDDYGSTVLFESLHPPNEEIFMALLERGFEVNFQNRFKVTPLHVSVVYAPTPLSNELIKRGAELNASDGYNVPLTSAVYHGNLETVSLLLYYGADANALGPENKTAFMWALERQKTEMAELLLHFNDFVDDDYSLHIALDKLNPLVMDILYMCNPDVQNWMELLEFAPCYFTNDLFKIMWSKSQSISAEFLVDFFDETNRFCNVDWWECWELMKETVYSFFADLANMYKLERLNFLMCALHGFRARSFRPDQIELFASVFFSSGLDINVNDINAYFSFFRFHNLDLLIYAFNYRLHVNIHYKLSPSLRLILIFEDYPFDVISFSINPKNIGHYALCYPDKDYIKTSCCSYLVDEITERLRVVPEVPSLREISRNKLREALKRICDRSRRAYEFYDMLRGLELPRRVEDLVVLKMPLYYS